MTNKEAIEQLKLNNPFMGGKDKELFSQAIDKGIEALENQKTGRWIRKNDICTSRVQFYQYACSNCREINTFSSNYCPYCGAKMEGDK